MVDAMIYKDLGVSAQDQQQVQESQTRRNRNPSFHLVCFFKKIKKSRQGSHGMGAYVTATRAGASWHGPAAGAARWLLSSAIALCHCRDELARYPPSHARPTAPPRPAPLGARIP
jgi:hypothetical protein